VTQRAPQQKTIGGGDQVTQGNYSISGGYQSPLASSASETNSLMGIDSSSQIFCKVLIVGETLPASI
jgi:hypothetical protein